MTGRPATEAGRPWPLGATPDGDGVNFALFSAHAEAVTLCLFDAAGTETRVALTERDGPVWHGRVAGVRPGQRYGYRVHGPFDPARGHRFNAAKLLLDPYARALTGPVTWDDALYGHVRGHPDEDVIPDPRDSAPFMPRAIVTDDAALALPAAPTRPDIPWSETVIYEAHPRGLTMAMPGLPADTPPGTFAALASPPVLDHLTRLGITAIELLPVHAFTDDRFLTDRGLRNYWGYMTHGFFAPEPRYLATGAIAEFRAMVDAFHGAGIEVILDVVYNHTAEADHLGPTLSFRGIDNASYYRLGDNPRFYSNDSGCGNTLDLTHPFVLRMVMDSLRYWAGVMGLDGFRFDLASVLGRTATGFDPDAPFFQALRQDPLLTRCKLIAEPWDLGPGGYRLGGYPPPFAEWNDRFRDGVRAFWRGDPHSIGRLAKRVAGSAARFDRDGRPPTASVNFIAAHDGFTLADTVSYAEKHNEANGEGNRDGHGHNLSDNLGVEGPTDDPAIRAARDRRRRNLMATLLLAQGTPMLLAGDELGNSQDGNNNAYCQDNTVGWVDWSGADDPFLGFVQRLIALRRAHPILRQARFLHAQPRDSDGRPDLFWRRADGSPMALTDWSAPHLRVLAAELRMARGTPPWAEREDALLLVFNGGADATVTLPLPPDGRGWRRLLDTAADQLAAGPCGAVEPVAADSVAVFGLGPPGAP